MEISQRIIEKCKEKGLSIRALEIKAGISNGAIKKWETQIPGCDKALNVANALNVSIEWLITGKEAESLNTEEKKLIENYRKADARGKRRIQLTADQEVQEQESSTFKIG